MKRRRRRGPPRTFRALPASNAVGAVLDRYRLRGNMREQAALRAWPSIVGARIAERAWPQLFRDGVLTVAVSNSSWLHQLSFMREDLVRQLNEAAASIKDGKATAEPLVREIRFELAHRKSKSLLTPFSRRLPVYPRRSPPPPASGDRAREIERHSAAVDDPELRAIIERTRKRWDV